MDSKEVIEINKKKKEEINTDLTVISSSLELEIEEQLAIVKAKALAESAEQTKELIKLETQISLMKSKLETVNKIEEKRQEAKSLALQLLDEDQKQAAYDEMKKRHINYINDLRKKYGLE